MSKTTIDRRHAGYTRVDWHVMDRMGNIQGGHPSREDAVYHASLSDGLTAYETTTVVRPIFPESEPKPADTEETSER